MTTRTNTQVQRKLPAGPHEWAKLMTQTIQRAERLRDPRLPGLRRAMTEGKAEAALRRLGILSSVDLDREFPDGG